MRQVGTLPTEIAARRFAAWLVAQRIEAHAEQEGPGFVVWVRDEDKMPQAREAFTHFRDHSDDPKYQKAEKSAETLLKEEETRRRQAQGNVVEMRGRWGSAGMPGAPRRAPVVKLLIGISALVAMLTWSDTMDRQPSRTELGEAFRALLFVDPVVGRAGGDGETPRSFDMWASIRKGEVWRLITPIFIHYGPMHIAFNMLMLYSFGSVVEDRRGTKFMLVLVLSVAIFSNLGQATEATIRGMESWFGGMSGVCYGVFGYIFIKSRFDLRERYVMNPGTTAILIGWLVLCILSDVPGFQDMLSAIRPVANSAHVVGLVVGGLIAYVPLVIRRAA